MDGISLSWLLLPEVLIERHQLQSRIISRGEGAEREIRFLYRDRHPVLPVWHGCEIIIVNWGRPSRGSPLPYCRTITHEALHEGELREVQPEPVEIPASRGWDRGIWYPIKEGVQGLLVRDRDGTPIVYVVTRESTRYYEVMTRNKRQPILIGQTI
jgi:hypothetical protein